MATIRFDAFDSRSRAWTRVTTIDLSGLNQGTWNFFGRLPGTEERTCGIPADFSNNHIYPRFRFSLGSALPQPLDFSIRIPRYGAIIGVSDLVFGTPVEAANVLTPYAETSWGYITLENVSGPTLPEDEYRLWARMVGVETIPCLSGDNVQEVLESLCVTLSQIKANLYIFVGPVDISEQMGATYWVVPHEKYVPGSLEVFENGQILTSPDDYVESNPAAGTFQIVHPLEVDERITVKYRVQAFPA